MDLWICPKRNGAALLAGNNLRFGITFFRGSKRWSRKQLLARDPFDFTDLRIERGLLLVFRPSAGLR
jgi:hypothetical protein